MKTDNPRRIKVKLSFTEKEYAEIKRIVEKENLTLSTFIRAIIFKQ